MIQRFSDVLRNQIESDGEFDRKKAARSISAVMKAAERGATLTQQLLAFSRRQKLQGRVVNLVDLIDQIQPLIARTAGGVVNVRIVHPETTCNARIDPTQAELAIINILLNARDAMPDGGNSSIEVKNRSVEEAEAIEQAAMLARSEPSGTLRVATSLPIGVHVIAPALPAFRRLHPSVAIDLRLRDRRIDIVEEGIDVAVRIGDLDDVGLMSRRLAACRLCAFASPDYLALRGVPAHPDELCAHDTVNLQYQSTGKPFRWPFNVGNRIMEIVPVSRIVADVSDAVLAALVAGRDIGVTATFLAAPYVARGELLPLLSEFSVEHHDVTALWPESRGANPAVRAFSDWLAGLFREEMSSA